MARSYAVALLAALLGPSLAHAQTETPPDLFTLKTPDSPALIALGSSSTEIQRPTTPKAFATALVSKFAANQGEVTIPQGFALEVAPYWLASHPNLTFEQLANADFFSSLVQNLTLSMATSGGSESEVAGSAADPADGESTSDAKTPVDVAFAVRTALVRPALSAEQRKCVDSIVVELNETADTMNAAIVAEVDEQIAAWWKEKYGDEALPSLSPPEKPSAPVLPAAPKTPDSASANYAAELSAFDEYGKAKQAANEKYAAELEAYSKGIDEYEASSEKLRERSRRKKEIFEEVSKKFHQDEKAARLKELDARLEPCMKTINARGDGFSVDAAAAFVESYPDARFESGKLSRGFAWGTLTYSMGNVSVLGLARYVALRADPEAELDQGLDLGGRVVIAADRWGLFAEGIRRSGIEEDVQSRYVGGFDYRLVDDTWFNVAFGKDYGRNDDGGLVALGSLQVNLGEQRLKPLDQQIKQ